MYRHIRHPAHLITARIHSIDEEFSEDVVEHEKPQSAVISRGHPNAPPSRDQHAPPPEQKNNRYVWAIRTRDISLNGQWLVCLRTGSPTSSKVTAGVKGREYGNQTLTVHLRESSMLTNRLRGSIAVLVTITVCLYGDHQSLPVSRRDRHRRPRDRSPMSRSSGRLTSRLGSVIKKTGRYKAAVSEDDSADEDTYNPTRPQVGSVASIIKVTERKSSIPEALQANKKLLLRAMADVTKSLSAPKLG